jgi:3-oxoisoapionate-4-phosphate transcarboxylase/hydrolase
MMAKVAATYLIESYYDLEQAAEYIAAEQSTGTFVRVPGETDDGRARFRARVIEVKPLETAQDRLCREPISRRNRAMFSLGKLS